MSDLPPERIALDTADSVEVLTLMDNACDLLLRGDERVRRAGFGSAGRVVAPLMLDASLPGVLVAEHGLSRQRRILGFGNSIVNAPRSSSLICTCKMG